MRAIDAAKSSGADVSADDFEFENWNPMENYTAELYEEKYYLMKRCCRTKQ